MDTEKVTGKSLNLHNEEVIYSLVQKHRLSLVYFLKGYVKDYSAAEDIASNAFVKLMLKKPVLRDENFFKTYLFSVAKNLALDYLKKNKQERLFLQTEAEPKEGQSPEEIICKNERQKAVLNCMSCLNKDYRSVLYLHYFENLALEDIVKVMKKNKKQIYNLLARAKAALAPFLEKEGINLEN